MKKTYSIILSMNEWNILRIFLKDNNMTYEPSQYYINAVNCSMTLTSEEYEKVSKFIEEKL